MKEMYKGKAFSPLTVLTKPINALETSIEVEDSSLLPTAPNYATIGDSETIKYGAVAGNILTDCIRGVEGEATAHEAGEEVARLFTALDYNTLVENVESVPEEISRHDEVFTQLCNSLNSAFSMDFASESAVLLFDTLDDVRASATAVHNTQAQRLEI